MIGSLLLASALAHAECTLLSGGEFITPTGRLVGSTLHLEDQRIQGFDPSPSQAESCNPLSLPEGSVVTAGFIESHTSLGLVEVSLEHNTVDSSSNESDTVRAGLRISDAYNPHSSLIPIARLGGISTAILVPSGGLVSGQGAAVDLAGASQHAALIRTPVGVYAHLGGRDGSRSQTLLRLRELLDDTEVYRQQKKAWERDALRPLAAERLDLEAMLPVANGEIPFVLRAERAADIEALLRLRSETGIRLVIVGGSEAWLLSEELALAEVPVILDPLVVGPGSFEQIHARADNAALLNSAGVPVILSSFSSHNARNLRQNAANAVRAGLPWEAALAAITQTPAQVFDLKDHGTLAPGSIANVAVFSGDPLEASSKLLHLWIRGEAIDLTSRQTALFEKYRTLPETD
ncbi:MAG: amidohydrolase family protein [Myxococcota bacterium]|nr:amidohydrolase family protein [Myxococcota bacterium]